MFLITGKAHSLIVRITYFPISFSQTILSKRNIDNVVFGENPTPAPPPQQQIPQVPPQQQIPQAPPQGKETK
ncbi:unnamed protein product [Adineta steineri]|uniref:Uncharacterized protein n=1 Tax=Adineta steineri TaxID=433720 RepID=A0A813MD77_9BILA|nr:unnamed protein product [Adineta steineri]CAF0754180.1 unnamed protein product [Adineta steineri]CAF0834329.1 unnamed protein product [Adineta steineri]